MSGVTASEDAEVCRIAHFTSSTNLNGKGCFTVSTPSTYLHILAEVTAEEMESEVQNKTWSIDELPQPLSSDVEPQDCQDMSRWLDYLPIADQVVTLLVLICSAMFGRCT